MFWFWISWRTASGQVRDNSTSETGMKFVSTGAAGITGSAAGGSLKRMGSCSGSGSGAMGEMGEKEPAEGPE